MLKWISSFPGNPRHGLPTVMGVVFLSDAATSAPVALLDARSVTALRTGAVAAVAARALARDGRADGRDRRLRAARRVGGALPGRRRLRPRRLRRPTAEAARALAAELGWARRRRAPPRWRCDVVCCVTPGPRARRRRRRPAPRPAPEHARRRRPGQGRGDGRGRHRLRAVLRRVGAGHARRRADRRGRGRALVTRDEVTDLGAVLAGDAPGRPDAGAVTLFDSTGLAIQDLAIAAAAYDAWREGRVEATTVDL